MIRIGVIGFGQQGKLYAAILSGTPLPGMPPIPQPEGCVLTAVSARNEAARPQIEALGAAYFQSWEALLASDACDAVVITVPHFVHHEITIRALEAGKHVLCEKPMTIRASDAEAILQARARNPKAKLAMMLNQRANSMLQAVKAIIDSGELGAIRNSYYTTCNWWRPDSYYASNPWRGTWSREGGGILVNQACHPLDIWLWLCGMPESVYARCLEGAHRNIGVENDVSVIARYPHGGQGVFTTCSHDLLGTNRLEITFDRGRITIEDNRKATILRYTRPEGEFGQQYDFRTFYGVLTRTPEAIYTKEEILCENGFCQDYVQIFRNFAAYILRGEAPIAPAEAGLAQVQLANAIQLSGWTGQEVAIPCSQEAYNSHLSEKIAQEGDRHVPE